MFRTLIYRYVESRKGIALFVSSLVYSLLLHFVVPLFSILALKPLIIFVAVLVLSVTIALFFLQVSPTICTLRLLGAGQFLCTGFFITYSGLLLLAGALLPAILHSLFSVSWHPLTTTLTCLAIAVILAVPVLLVNSFKPLYIA